MLSKILVSKEANFFLCVLIFYLFLRNIVSKQICFPFWQNTIELEEYNSRVTRVNMMPLEGGNVDNPE